MTGGRYSMQSFLVKISAKRSKRAGADPFALDLIVRYDLITILQDLFKSIADHNF